MNFDVYHAILVFSSGTTLLIAANLCRFYEKTIFAPATLMLLTWGIALLALAFLPMVGFYPLSVESLLLYTFGSLWFSLVAITTLRILNAYQKTRLNFGPRVLDQLDYRGLVIVCGLVSIFCYPMAVKKLMNYGSSITEISFFIRQASVSGDPILGVFLGNMFVVLGVLVNTIFYGFVQNKVRMIVFIFVSVPFIFFSLVMYGRSSLVSLILSWLVMLSLFSSRFKIFNLIVPLIFMILVLFLGAVWVKKIDVEGATVSSAVLVFIDHIFGYLYQGPILFSRYFSNEISVSANMDFLGSVCHVFSKFNLCLPDVIHSDFSLYGEGRSGNVYSMYFSIVPKYGLLGLILVFGFYAVVLAFLFKLANEKRLLGLVVYPIMASALVLSVYKDGIGYSFYWFVKVLFICLFIKLLFFDKIFMSILGGKRS